MSINKLHDLNRKLEKQNQRLIIAMALTIVLGAIALTAINLS